MNHRGMEISFSLQLANRLNRDNVDKFEKNHYSKFLFQFIELFFLTSSAQKKDLFPV